MIIITTNNYDPSILLSFFLIGFASTMDDALHALRSCIFRHYLDQSRVLVLPVLDRSASFLLKRSHLRKLGIRPNILARVFRCQSVLSYSFSEKTGHIRIPAPIHKSYSVAGIDDSDDPDDISASSDSNTTNANVRQDQPAPNPPSMDGAPEEKPHDPNRGDLSFSVRGKPTSPRSFTESGHSHRFNFLTTGVLPKHLQLHAKLSPTVKAIRRKKAKSFKANTKRRYKVHNGHLQYNTAQRKKKTLSAQALSDISPWRTIPFADEEYDIVHTAHHAHHECINALEAVLKRTWMIPHVRAIANHVRKRCSKCENFAPPHKVGPIWIITDRPSQLLMFDLSKLSVSLQDGTVVQLLLVVDHFTKYKWFKLVLGKETEPICDFLTQLCNSEGTPERWHADNGSEFKNKYIDEVRRRLKLNDGDDGLLPYTHSVPRNPQCQGLVERGNRTVKNRLVKKFQAYTDEHPDSDITLDLLTQLTREVLDGLNTGPVKMYGNVTPHLLQRGRPHLMSQFSTLKPTMLEELHRKCAEAQVKRASKHTDETRTRPDIFRTYELGSVVKVACKTQSMKKKEAPQGQRWPWLATIERRCLGADDCYKLRWITQGPTSYDRPGIVGKRYFHVVQMKPGTPEEQEKYGITVEGDKEGTSASDDADDDAGNDVDDDASVSGDEGHYDFCVQNDLEDEAVDDKGNAGEQYEVEAILARRVRTEGSVSVEEFKIRWTGFDSASDTWEPGDGIRESCSFLFYKFACGKCCDKCQQFPDSEPELRTCRNCKDKVCYTTKEGVACCWNSPSWVSEETSWVNADFCASCMDHLEDVHSGMVEICKRCGTVENIKPGWTLKLCPQCGCHVCFAEGQEGYSSCWNNFTWENEACCAECMGNKDHISDKQSGFAEHIGAPTHQSSANGEQGDVKGPFQLAWEEAMRTAKADNRFAFRPISSDDANTVQEAINGGVDRFLDDDLADRSVTVQAHNMKLARDGYLSDEFIEAALSLYQLAGEHDRSQRTNICLSTFEIPLQEKQEKENSATALTKLKRRLARKLKYCRLEQVDLIFIPVNSPKSKHWFLVVADIRHQDVLVFDSGFNPNNNLGWPDHIMHDAVVRACARLASGLSTLAGEKDIRSPKRFAFLQKKILTAPIHGIQQVDGRSCGVFLLWTVRALIEGRLPMFESTKGMRIARYRLILEVYTLELQPYENHFNDDLPPLWRSRKPRRPRLSKSMLSDDDSSPM